MKLILTITALFFTCFIFSCSKSDVIIVEKSFDLTVTGNNILYYNMSLSKYGDGPYILKKPKHSLLSQIKRIAGNPGYYAYEYRYLAENGYSGNDYTEIEFRDGMLSSGEEFNRFIMKLNIKVEK